MFFNNTHINCILNKLLSNNKEARHYVVDFFKNAPEGVLEAIRKL